ncbi:DEAD-box helicase Dbp80-like [Macrosteles quadrilineatus]|uniref:DEAD-box helicase Dbp80-like n=1 Tax=Macrosteles quadrilineatus TaxID=74068 RepID=UPI0023E1DD87|nr:DEAD-box helicase Dbp80-like [Macrosteles quadrilineatus]XP_054275680.1 DEAD-box helicase Dbp80-like [Macrosteles quadrilineatus]XP_054275681.1 DEAD-box helicase Dbp80-like [Macrosteles quadrilineatus]
MMFFSTTYNDSVMDFAEAIVYNPVLIRLRREEESLDNIEQYYVVCSNHGEQYMAISNIYGLVTIGQTIIFCCKRRTASRLAEKMTKNRHTVALLTGELPVSQRLMTLNRFREGKDRVLITTDVLARGIDFESANLVVNYELPLMYNIHRNQKYHADCETYLHRIGRTGRLGKEGIAVNLIHCSQAFKTLRQIKEHFGKEIERLEIDDLASELNLKTEDIQCFKAPILLR